MLLTLKHGETLAMTSQENDLTVFNAGLLLYAR